jgi:GNAT superfamily N-acetyltransferase
MKTLFTTLTLAATLTVALALAAPSGASEPTGHTGESRNAAAPAGARPRLAVAIPRHDRRRSRRDGASSLPPAGVHLAGAGVLPAARGRGVYHALVAARWREGIARGTPALTVQAGDMSRPILEQLGFVAVAETSVLCDRIRPPMTAPPARTKSSNNTTRKEG